MAAGLTDGFGGCPRSAGPIRMRDRPHWLAPNKRWRKRCKHGATIYRFSPAGSWRHVSYDRRRRRRGQQCGPRLVIVAMPYQKTRPMQPKPMGRRRPAPGRVHAAEAGVEVVMCRHQPHVHGVGQPATGSAPGVSSAVFCSSKGSSADHRLPRNYTTLPGHDRLPRRQRRR